MISKVILKLATFNIHYTRKYLLKICEKYVTNAVFTPWASSSQWLFSVTVTLPTLEILDPSGWRGVNADEHDALESDRPPNSTGY